MERITEVPKQESGTRCLLYCITCHAPLMKTAINPNADLVLGIISGTTVYGHKSAYRSRHHIELINLDKGTSVTFLQEQGFQIPSVIND